MFLQIFIPDAPTFSERLVEFYLNYQLLFVILGLAIGIFISIKLVKFLTGFKITKTNNKPVYIN